jgi:hypothetical protein
MYYVLLVSARGYYAHCGGLCSHQRPVRAACVVSQAPGFSGAFVVRHSAEWLAHIFHWMS